MPDPGQVVERVAYRVTGLGVSENLRSWKGDLKGDSLALRMLGVLLIHHQVELLK